MGTLHQNCQSVNWNLSLESGGELEALMVDPWGQSPEPDLCFGSCVAREGKFVFICALSDKTRGTW